MPLMPSRTWREELLLNYPLRQEMKGINALNLEPALPRCVTDASPKSKLRKDFKQYLERRRLRLARVEEDNVVHAEVDTQEVQVVMKGGQKLGPQGVT